MITKKYTDKVIAVLVALAAAATLVFCAFGQNLTIIAEADDGVTMEYESKLFDTDSPLDINIVVDEDDWADMLENATDEEYILCDIEIDGVTFSNVGIRPKGNTSLSAIAGNPDTDRYSFKVEFDHYVEGQTCYGLDKLVLNNNYADATMMKEALVYDMYEFLGADASLYNYAKISVNGEYWGLYLALEAIEESFLTRNYGVDYGELYKPEPLSMGGGGEGGGPDTSDFDFDGEMPDMGDFGGEMPDMGDFDGGGGFGGMSGSGADLNYTDDDLDSYSTIWDGEVTDTDDDDHERVVEALKNISEGTDLEEYMDIDNLLKYMAVHEFVVNADSLSENMAHNYYLYEDDGQLNLIPWDYNLTLGGMNGDDASSVVNDPIDSPFDGTDFFDALLENEEYLAQYHEYLRQLCEEYVNGGLLDEFFETTRANIDELVETDPTAFYTYDEYTDAADMLYEVVLRRAESILGQLDGTIPPTEEGQREDDSALIDCSDIDISVMGSMNTGGTMGGGGGFQGGFGGFGHFGGGPDSNQQGGSDSEPDSDSSDRPTPPDGNFPAEDMEGMTEGELPEGFDPTQMGQAGTTAESADADTDAAETAAEDTDAEDAAAKDAEAATEANDAGTARSSNSSLSETARTNLMWCGISAGLLAAALIFAKVFRRR